MTAAITTLIAGYLALTVVLGLFGGRRNDALAEQQDRDRQARTERGGEAAVDGGVCEPFHESEVARG